MNLEIEPRANIRINLILSESRIISSAYTKHPM